MDAQISDLIEIIHFTERVAARIHGLLDEAEIYRAVMEEFSKSGHYTASILLLSEDGSKLRIAETSENRTKLSSAERSSGLRLKKYQIDLDKSNIYRQVVREWKTLQVNTTDIVNELFPKPLARLIVKLMGYGDEHSLLTPLSRRGKIIGALAMSSTTLAEHFIPSVKALAEHISTALELAEECAERQRAEERLRESEERFRSLVETATDAILSIDDQANINFWNHQAETMFGYADSEIIGRPLVTIIPEQSRESFKTGFEHMLHKGTPQIAGQTLELVGLRKDGHQFPIELSVATCQAGKETRFTAIIRDITERKQMEEELKRSEQFNFNLIEQSPHPIVVVDLDRKIRRVNKALEELTGFSAPEVIGLQTPYPWWTEQDAEEKSNRDRQAALARKRQRFEEKFHKKSGELFWAEVTPMAIVIDGRPQYYMYMWTDITERKQMEGELKERYEQERNLRGELEREIKKRIEFTRIIVHELKTPLTSIMVSSDLLTAEIKEELLLELAQSINRSAANLNSRIDELLDMARGEMGMLKLNPKWVEPLKLLSGLARDMTPVVQRRQQSINLELPGSLPQVRADEDRLRQIVLNLLTNASKFTPAGGKITLRARKEASSLTVEVEDNGHGIAKKEQERLFQPYYRLEQDKERTSGLGLGLALSKTLVELHGGKIWVRSKPGQGATFGFSLPLESRQTVLVQTEPASKASEKVKMAGTATDGQNTHQSQQQTLKMPL